MAFPLPVLDDQPHRPDYARGPRHLASVKLLRISITDRCNLRCRYCMPEEGTPFYDREDVLEADELLAVAEAGLEAGIDHFKITGGEPTVRGDVVEIVERLARLGPSDLSMTTNGLMLERLAGPLREAGLDRLTLSCDSLRPERYGQITRGRGDPRALLDRFHAGVEAAGAAGFERLKFNVVVMGGVNEDEVADFARLTYEHPWTIRFIEYMPLGEATLVSSAEAATVSNVAIRRSIERALGRLVPVERAGEPGVGPAEVYALAGARGRLGFISAMSAPFCENCNRLRLTARGELRACLFEGGEVDIRPALRPEPDPARLRAAFAACVQEKPEVHTGRGHRAMSQLGG